MPEIVFAGVGHSYGDRSVLEHIDLRLTERRIGIVGANGSGKSTFARMINGLVHPSRGRVTVDGVDAARRGREVRRRVGFVFSDADNQIIMPTVAEDVAFSLRRAAGSRAEKRDRVDGILTRFGLDGHAEHPPHRLSGGQKQLLALASVLVTEPDVVVADEPTTLLDLRNSRMIRESFAALPQQLVVVTHDLGLLADFDRVIVIDAGRVVEDSAPATAIARYTDLMGSP